MVKKVETRETLVCDYCHKDVQEFWTDREVKRGGCGQGTDWHQGYAKVSIKGVIPYRGEADICKRCASDILLEVLNGISGKDSDKD